MSRNLTEVELDILNVLYFVEPVDKILEEVNHPKQIVLDSLKFLIRNKYVTPMKWDEDSGEFSKTFFYDSDNMGAYRYLATKEGLIAHNSR
jgi:hypothetical protein